MANDDQRNKQTRPKRHHKEEAAQPADCPPQGPENNAIPEQTQSCQAPPKKELPGPDGPLGKLLESRAVVLEPERCPTFKEFIEAVLHWERLPEPEQKLFADEKGWDLEKLEAELDRLSEQWPADAPQFWFGHVFVSPSSNYVFTYRATKWNPGRDTNLHFGVISEQYLATNYPLLKQRLAEAKPVKLPGEDAPAAPAEKLENNHDQTSFWTSERVNTLRELTRSNWTDEAIAGHFRKITGTGVSTSAICKARQRNGITKRKGRPTKNRT